MGPPMYNQLLFSLYYCNVQQHQGKCGYTNTPCPCTHAHAYAHLAIVTCTCTRGPRVLSAQLRPYSTAYTSALFLGVCAHFPMSYTPCFLVHLDRLFEQQND